jgi:hypothetical protein
VLPKETRSVSELLSCTALLSILYAARARDDERAEAIRFRDESLDRLKDLQMRWLVLQPWRQSAPAQETLLPVVSACSDRLLRAVLDMVYAPVCTASLLPFPEASTGGPSHRQCWPAYKPQLDAAGVTALLDWLPHAYSSAVKPAIRAILSRSPAAKIGSAWSDGLSISAIAAEAQRIWDEEVHKQCSLFDVDPAALERRLAQVQEAKTREEVARQHSVSDMQRLPSKLDIKVFSMSRIVPLYQSRSATTPEDAAAYLQSLQDIMID